MTQSQKRHQLISSIDDVLKTVDYALMTSSKLRVRVNVDQLIESSAPCSHDDSILGIGSGSCTSVATREYAIHKSIVLYCMYAGHMCCDCLEGCPCLACCPCSQVSADDPFDWLEKEQLNMTGWVGSFGAPFLMRTINNFETLLYMQEFLGPDYPMGVDCTVNEAIYNMMRESFVQYGRLLLRRQRMQTIQILAASEEGEEI